VSHFTTLRTRFTEVEHLLAALTDLGFAETQIQRHEVPVALFGYEGDERPQRAEIVIRRQHVGPLSNDIGFARQADGTYQALISEFDRRHDYDQGWLEQLTQRYAYHAARSRLAEQGFDLVAEAAGRFYGVASRYPVEGKSREQDWEAVTKLARERVKTHKISQGQRWKEVLKKASKKLSKWIELWRSRPREDWCHGDLHLGNAMTRSPAPDGPALLFDFALTRRGHWVEDAVYFEHLFWARPDRLEGRNLCKLVSQARKAQGLPVGSDWAQLAAVRRAFLAISVPADLEHHSDPAQLDAALAVLEQQM